MQQHLIQSNIYYAARKHDKIKNKKKTETITRHKELKARTTIIYLYKIHKIIERPELK